MSQLPFRQGVRLAVDVGSVRVGVARSDPGGILASPLAVLASGPGAKAAQARAELAILAASEGAIEVIVGLPTSLSGREGTAAAGAREFAADLAGRLAPVPVRLSIELDGRRGRLAEARQGVPGRVVGGGVAGPPVGDRRSIVELDADV